MTVRESLVVAGLGACIVGANLVVGNYVLGGLALGYLLGYWWFLRKKSV